MRTAIIGAGAAGLGAAYSLSKAPIAAGDDVYLFEAEAEPGGHAYTQDVEGVGLDLGFILSTPLVYPTLHGLFAQYDLAVEDILVDLRVQVGDKAWGTGRGRNCGGYQADVDGDAARFEALLDDLGRRIADAERKDPAHPALPPEALLPIDELARSNGYSDAFFNAVVAPALSVLLVTRGNTGATSAVPAYIVATFVHAGAVSFVASTPWNTVRGGTQQYAKRLRDDLVASGVHVQTSRKVTRVTHTSTGWHLTFDGSTAALDVDRVVLAVDGDTARSLLKESTETHDVRAALRELEYQDAVVELHEDLRFVENVRSPEPAFRTFAMYEQADVPKAGKLSGALSFDLGVAYPSEPKAEGRVLTIRDAGGRAPDPSKVLATRTWKHLLWTKTSLADRVAMGAVQGKYRLWLCGAHTSLPCHEDAFLSGVAIAEELGAPYPFAKDGIPSDPVAYDRYLGVRAEMSLGPSQSAAKDGVALTAPLHLAAVRKALTTTTTSGDTGPDAALEHVDVVVIGAGPAGLAATCRLRERASVVTLEARGRVGGRAFTRRLSDLGISLDGHLDAPVDMGATYVSPKLHGALLDLLSVGGLRLVEAPKGTRVLCAGGAALPYAGSIPPVDGGQVPRGADIALEMLQVLATSFDPAHPEAADPGLLALDDLSVRQWATTAFSDPANMAGLSLSPEEQARLAELTELLLAAIIGSPADTTSMFYFLWYLATSGGPIPLMGDAQGMRVLGGVGAAFERVAQALGTEVRLGCAVEKIETRKGGGAVVTYRDAAFQTRQLKAKAVILAVPPTLARDRITFDPPLSTPPSALLPRLTTTPGVRAIMVYPRAFWRDAGLSGEMVSVEDPAGAPLTATFDVSPEGGRPGVLIGFSLPVGEPSERRAKVLAQLARAFGPEAGSARYAELDWHAHEEWSRGAAAVAPSMGTLKTGWFTFTPGDVAPLFWAGAWVTPQSFCYMDGAVRAGQLAAERALGAL